MAVCDVAARVRLLPSQSTAVGHAWLKAPQGVFHFLYTPHQSRFSRDRLRQTPRSSITSRQGGCSQPAVQAREGIQGDGGGMTSAPLARRSHCTGAPCRRIVRCQGRHETKACDSSVCGVAPFKAEAGLESTPAPGLGSRAWLLELSLRSEPNVARPSLGLTGQLSLAEAGPDLSGQSGARSRSPARDQGVKSPCSVHKGSFVRRQPHRCVHILAVTEVPLRGEAWSLSRAPEPFTLWLVQGRRAGL